MSPSARHGALLDRATTVLVVVDVQEAYRPVLHEFDRTAATVARLVAGAAVLGVPVLATEQYTKGLGHTVPEVAERFPPDALRFEKMALSCCGVPDFMAALTALARRQVLLAGIETHACMNQTAHDLIAAGYQVHVPYDATSSRHAADVPIAWEKMRAAGVLPATSESALLELVRTAESPDFKAIQRLIR
jgi:nicotinamidase-related amidase